MFRLNVTLPFHLFQEIVVGSNMDKIYIVMNYVEHDLKSLMETMKQPFLPGNIRNCWVLYSINWSIFFISVLHQMSVLHLTNSMTFVPSGEVKTLMIQLLRGVRHLHDNWILHRDLKTSNLLLSHKGILKVRLNCGSHSVFHQSWIIIIMSV